jgi:protein-disulfide isomerase
MRTWVRTTLAMIVVVALGLPAVAFADEATKVIEYFRKKSNLPPNLPAKVADLKDSGIKGAREGVIEIGNAPNVRKQPFLISSDGRYVVFASVDDLTVDPFEQIRNKISLKDRPSKGPKDAKVTIVEYSEFQCPYCKRGHETVRDQVLKEYGDRVKLVFKHFPLQSIHPWAEPAAVASDCVFKQNPAAFWKVHDALFDGQREINLQNLKDKVHAAVAADGVDKAALDDCIDNQRTLAQVKADQEEGISVGVTGTPAFFINGRMLSGAQPFERFKAIIDDELASRK